jgi:hypothetical protein
MLGPVMTVPRRTWAAAALIGGILGCAGASNGTDGGLGSEETSAEPGRAAHAAAAGPLVGWLETNEARIAVVATRGGPRYTVHDASGRPIATDLDADTLARLHPRLGEIVQRGAASYLDAGLDGRLRARRAPRER